MVTDDSVRPIILYNLLSFKQTMNGFMVEIPELVLLHMSPVLYIDAIYPSLLSVKPSTFLYRHNFEDLPHSSDPDVFQNDKRFQAQSVRV